MEILNKVLAHTGNDSIEHGMESFDWTLLVLIVISLILIISWLMKKKKSKK
tara:strand:+ start:1723 stop:1875 length:153 start_codon:yes stop_codon:yes gene_type:complete